MASSTIGSCGLFAGGENGGLGNPSGAVNAIDIYNQDLTRVAGPELTYRKYGSAAIELGESVIIAGGWCDTGFPEWEVITRKSVDVIERTSDVTIGIGANARYSFDGTERQALENIELTLPSPVSGYIKYKSNVIH